jgi:D-serine deaminase-like pyridoxal phosphate-dependent protein
MTIRELETPVLLLDRQRMDANIARMGTHLRRLGVAQRPHVKTTKSIEILRRIHPQGMGPITVSTLKEAEYFAGYGVRDILYAVAIAPGKLTHAADLIRRGVQLTLILDSVESAREVVAGAAREGVELRVLIELDVDGHRAGVAPESDRLLDIGRVLHEGPGTKLLGVMTHAGGSYDCRSVEALREMAERERAGSVRAAERLRAVGLPAPVVSVGSTPTATFAQNLTGVTEVRAGVYVLQDLVMAGIGVCSVDDIAASVLVSVIGHQVEKGWIITDGGWMALSRDRGTAEQPIDQGFGVVRDAKGGTLADDLIVVSANQEHGILARRDGSRVDVASYPVGTLLRVLPNHACGTCAQHSRYVVVAGASPEIVATWERINGW